MAIDDLTKLLPPSSNRLEAGPPDRWTQVEQSMGTKLPADLREFGLTYGTGRIRASSLTIWVFNPFAEHYKTQVDDNLAAWRSLKESEGRREVPFELFPDTPGLLPWGADDIGGGLFWLTEGMPESWPIMVKGRSKAKFRRLEITLTCFLAQALSGQLSLPGVWVKSSIKNPTFEPLQLTVEQQRYSVYDLYVANGLRAGFWIMHQNWEGSNTDALLKSIGGKTEGALNGNSPDYGSPSVLVDVYVKGKVYETNHDLGGFAADKGFRKVDPPAWWSETQG